MVAEWKNPSTAHGIISSVSIERPDQIPLSSFRLGGGIIGQLLSINNSNNKSTWIGIYTTRTQQDILFIKLNKDGEASSRILPKTLDVEDCRLDYKEEKIYLLKTMDNKLIIEEVKGAF